MLDLAKPTTMRAVIVRLKGDDKQTLGRFFLFDGIDLFFQCACLELPWKDNAHDVSCIPLGSYVITPADHDHFGRHFDITPVKDRSGIKIHSGNYASQIRGCVLVGRDFMDINSDGSLDVTFSKATLGTLAQFVQTQIKLTII